MIAPTRYGGWCGHPTGVGGSLQAGRLPKGVKVATHFLEEAEAALLLLLALLAGLALLLLARLLLLAAVAAGNLAGAVAARAVTAGHSYTQGGHFVFGGGRPDGKG
jgi:hypothetical protein